MLQVQFWITRSQASLMGAEGLHMTHLNAAVGDDWWNIHRDVVESISFHTAADPGSLALTSGDVIGEIHSDIRPWSNVLFDGIKSWHRNCRANHVNCNQTLSKTQSFDCDDVALPTRYIEIIPGDESVLDQSRLRFILREALGERGRYISLSHRWTEKSKDAMTTRENYLCRTRSCAHKTSCSTWGRKDLTELFGEASWLAVNLGITKIWIDSICIIQDDLNDWEKESVKMAEYYQFAWLTIAATQTTPTGGLRSDLQPTDIPRLARLPYRDSNGKQDGYFYLQVVDHKALENDYLRQVTKSELLNRGWVFQEWLLSRRTLSFSGASWGIFMQCQNGDNPQAITGDHVRTQTGLKIDKAFEKNLQMSWSSRPEVFAAWRAVVETYSSSELTQIDEDRLVALSGVAHEYGKALQALEPTGILHGQNELAITACTYSAGIWLGDTFSLLWEQAESQTCSKIQSISTWSWACIKIESNQQDDQRSPRGAQVQWPSFGRRIEPVGRAECAITRHHDGSTWVADSAEPPGTHLNDRYGNKSRFSVLKMRGKVVQVSVDAHLTRDSRITTAGLTEHSLSTGREHWRAVATYKTPEKIAGWASLEHPDYQNDAACRSAQNIVAFFVLTSYSGRPSFALGNIYRSHTIHSVLYLRPVENPTYRPCYERVGVGRLFEVEVSELFQAATEQILWIT
ncbi:hypothetical protein IQ07DRAFT_641408 [Pyrenochaeta sp. DS3sAY3a]|nr:hypothetical protein IQ07DRAFT_641408 [Pyrenochaeta sp. DS3sAY3a]